MMLLEPYAFLFILIVNWSVSQYNWEFLVRGCSRFAKKKANSCIVAQAYNGYRINLPIRQPPKLDPKSATLCPLTFVHFCTHIYDDPLVYSSFFGHKILSYLRVYMMSTEIVTTEEGSENLNEWIANTCMVNKLRKSPTENLAKAFQIWLKKILNL